MTGARSPVLVAVIPTKDRWMVLPRLLAALDTQTCPPARVVVVDASRDPPPGDSGGRPLSEWVTVLRHQPPSAAAQRNRGIRTVLEQADLIALLDDDITLAPDALERMIAFWSSERAAGVVGAGFNQTDLGPAAAGGLKRSRLAERLGLYARRPGAVAPSGWQTVIGTVARDTAVDWLPTGAAVWRADGLAALGGFDEYFVGYSYLEDLEFSWRARRLGRLVVVADARCTHGNATAGKITAREFGRVEVRNRIYFVHKHGLSRSRCTIGLMIRGGLTLASAIRRRDRYAANRFLGNLRGLAEAWGSRSDWPQRAPTTGHSASTDTQTRPGPSPGPRRGPEGSDASPARPRVLVCAFACNPDQGSEEGVGWNWVQAIAGFCDATVITADFHRAAIEAHVERTGAPWATRVRFVYPASRPWHYRPSPGWRKIEESLLKPLMHLAYIDWLRGAARMAADLIDREPFDLTHQLTYVGFRFPGGLWRLPLPFAWGPIGGLEDTPWRLFGALDARGMIYHAAYNLTNRLHRSLLRAPRQAALRAGPGLIAATAGIAHALRDCYGTPSTVISEVTAPPPRRGQLTARAPAEPLHILWSGAHIPGKALPLLLHALNDVPSSVAWQLSIFGAGPSTHRWRRLAGRLGVGERCGWRGQVTREAMLAAFDSAHLFVITSLKDLTSTVLVEALSRGVPVLCPDHCGFGEALGAHAGLRLPITSPAGFVGALRDAIVTLYDDEAQRRCLANGARLRAREFAIDTKTGALRDLYARLLASRRDAAADTRGAARP